MKPILFNTDMVRAILDGRKTVTRRVVKPQPLSKLAYICMGHKHGTWAYPCSDAWKYWEDESFRLPDGLTDADKARRWTPPCHTGDILYVRETWRKDIGRYMYKANYFDREKFYRDGKEVSIKWRPSIHMPREAARIFLRVTDVRVERLQDVTEEQVMAEGMPPGYGYYNFGDIWDSTIKPADCALYGWEASPWVWVIEFKRISKEEAEQC